MYPVPERKAQGGGWLEDGDHDEFAELLLTADDQGLFLLRLLPLVKDSRQECEQPDGDVWFFLLIIIECGGAGEPPFLSRSRNNLFKLNCSLFDEGTKKLNLTKCN